MIIQGCEVKIHVDKENSRITLNFHANVNNREIKPPHKTPIPALVHSLMDALMSSEMGRRVTSGRMSG